MQRFGRHQKRFRFCVVKLAIPLVQRLIAAGADAADDALDRFFRHDALAEEVN